MTRPDRGARAFRRSFASLLGASALVLAAATAPASATSTSVATIGQLETALADCTAAPNTISLTADIAAGGTELSVPCDTTLDLGVHDLSVLNIVIDPGIELTVAGPVDGTGGTLTTDASPVFGVAGIQTTGATLRVTGGTVLAIAGANAAAIGGPSAISQSTAAGTLIVEGGDVEARASDFYAAAVGGGYGGGFRGDGGVVTVSGGSLTAIAHGSYTTAIGGGGGGVTAGTEGHGPILTVTGGIVRATATGSRAVAIGGGIFADGSPAGGHGGSIYIGPAGTVVASSPFTAIGGGANPDNTPAAFGTVVVDGVLSIPSGRLVVTDTGIAAETELQVSATGRLVGDIAAPATGAAISGSGQIANAGIIALAPPASMVGGNNRLLTFSNGATAVRVFAPTTASGYRSIPAPPVGTLWGTAADGTGEWFTSASDTAGSGTTALYALVPGSFEVSADPAELTATAGAPFAFPVTVLGADGSPLGPQPPVAFSSTDCPFTGPAVFETAGTCTITASATVEGVALETSFPIEVVAGPLDALTLTPSATRVAQGGTLSFQVAGVDAFGNPVDAAAAVLTSSMATDVVSGRSVTFPHASPHVITATLGGVTASITVEVEPRPAALGTTGVSTGTLLALLVVAVVLLLLGVAAVVLRRRRS